MDNKKWYSRFTTSFWFLLATLPFWLSAIQLIFSYLIHTDSLSLSDINSYINGLNYNVYFTNNSNFVDTLTPHFLSDMFDSLFGAIDSNIALTLSVPLAWFVWTYLVHIFLDVAIWLPKIFHKWLDRWC